jgi:hypothetical protein
MAVNTLIRVKAENPRPVISKIFTQVPMYCWLFIRISGCIKPPNNPFWIEGIKAVSRRSKMKKNVHNCADKSTVKPVDHC